MIVALAAHSLLPAGRSGARPDVSNGDFNDIRHYVKVCVRIMRDGAVCRIYGLLRGDVFPHAEILYQFVPVRAEWRQHTQYYFPPAPAERLCRKELVKPVWCDPGAGCGRFVRLRVSCSRSRDTIQAGVQILQ